MRRNLATVGIVVHGEEHTVRVRAGRVQHVILTVHPVTDLSDRIAAGKAVRDSVHANAAVVATRLDNMRGAHTAVAELAVRTRAELKALREKLSGAPPTLPGLCGEECRPASSRSEDR